LTRTPTCRLVGYLTIGLIFLGLLYLAGLGVAALVHWAMSPILPDPEGQPAYHVRTDSTITLTGETA
jgi:hypothetical protein